MAMLKLVGDPISSSRVQATLGFIERHFNAPNSGRSGTSFESPSFVNGYIDVGWRGSQEGNEPFPSYNGALTIMKALLSYGVDTISIDEKEIDWQAELDEVILSNQDDDGHWQGGGYPPGNYEPYTIYHTAWAMMTLSRSVPTIAVTSVSLSCPEEKLEIGEPVTIKATVLPTDANDPSISWASSEPKVATVADGVVTPLKAGSTDITVTTTDGNHKAKCTVVVKAKPNPVKVEVDDQDDIKVVVKNLEKSVEFTDEEAQQEIIIRLVVQLLLDNEVNQTDKTLLETYVKEHIKSKEHAYVYLDISLFKIVGQDQTKLTSSLEPLTISFILPKELRDKDFKFLRVHNEKVEELVYEYNKDTFEITFVTDDFSTYAMVYGDDTLIVDTSDQSHVGGWLLFAGLFLLLFSYVYKKEEKEEIKE